MRELIYKPLGQFQPLIQGENPSNIKARLNQKLPEEMRATFAFYKTDGSNGIWFGEKDNADYRPYSEAQGADRDAIGMALDAVRNYVITSLKDEFPFAEELFRVPSKDAIFWYKDNGRTIPVLTQWGFLNKNEANAVDIIDIMIGDITRKMQQEVTLRCNYTDGSPASEFPFRLDVFNHTEEKMTDEEGCFHMGNFNTGIKFAVEDSRGGQRQEFTVAEGENYVAVFKVNTSFCVTVRNQLGDTKPNFKILIDEKEYVTEADGAVRIDSYPLSPDPVTVTLITGNNPATFVLNRDPQANDFTYKVEDVLPEPPYRITLRYFDGTPLKNMQFDIVADGVKDPIQVTTDQNGVATLPPETLKEGKYKVQVKLSKEQRKQIEADIKQQKRLEKQQKKQPKKQ